MKILLANKFFFLKGGSETSFFHTAKVLKDRDHEVIYFSMSHPDNIDSHYSKYFVSQIDFENPGSLIDQMKASARILYSFEAQKKLDQLVEEEKPDVAHLHNIHHQISPSILHTLKKHNLPVVMTLHDYKMVCPIYTLLGRNGICEKCMGGKYFHCFLNKCTKNSYLKSLLNMAEMYLHHSFLHSYDFVDEFISPSMFLKEKLAQMGFDREISCLPNFINVDEYVPSFHYDEKTVVYFGRLSKEKGLSTLFSAMKGLEVQCKIFGDGPAKEDLERRVRDENIENIFFFGHKGHEDLKKHVQKAMFAVLPSEWYENNPLTVVEAFALGKPVIGSRIGGLPELIENFKTGLTFEHGNPAELRRNILWLLSHPDKIIEMGRNARRFVENSCNPECHYLELIKIYHRAMAKHN